MTLLSARQFTSILAIALLFVLAEVQPALARASMDTGAGKPYKILTSGKQVTVKSTRDIKNVMVWTASGHRIVEQREINANSFSFHVDNINEKFFFLMIQYEGQKPFTEKIGVR
ncbi:MAG: hypothetical protein Q8941_00845 [Bacteroidota bacterium]|nr:hypothetical protein [Bacteroidota bacterium]